MLEWKIINGTIIDGTGAEPRRADLGGRGDRIAVIDDLAGAPAGKTYDAGGAYVCPGFIDAHSHSDTYLLIEPSAPSKIYQGVTTEITGNCGASAAPLLDRNDLPSDWNALEYPGEWRTFAEYKRLLEKAHPALNVGLLVGHGKLRQWAMGNEPRPATASEIAVMSALLSECLSAGAIGMSSGLIYAPGHFADATELNKLAEILAAHEAVYATHMRSEGAGLPECIDENIALSRATGVCVQISHLKTSGKNHWHMLDAVLDKLRAARNAGINIAADRYPYTAGCTDLDVIFPDWAAGGGRAAILQRLRNPADRARLLEDLRRSRPPEDWQNVIIATTNNPEFRGRPLPEIARALQTDAMDAALSLIDADNLQTSAFFAGMSTDNMWRILAEPYVMIGSDASIRAPTGLLSTDHPHPRAYGAFPNFLKAALTQRTVPLPEAIRKMTSLPAKQFRLPGRGLLTPGYMADIAVFNPAELDDPADYHRPHQLARGMRMVMVNGEIVLDAGELTGKCPGRILRHAHATEYSVCN